MKTKNLFFLISLLISCGTFAQKYSNYSINKEMFFIKGKWKLQDYYEPSGEFLLSNKKNEQLLSISVRNPEYFELYNDSLTDLELLKKYYLWEYDYWKDHKEIKSKVNFIKKNDEKKYIVWSLIRDIPNSSYKDNKEIILYAIRNKKLISIGISNTNNGKKPLTDYECIDFIEKLFLVDKIYY